MEADDEAFADIVRQEFDEQWTPPRSPVPPVAVPPPVPVLPPPPLPDFHLNLYDDEESYREVPPTGWAMSNLTWGAVGLVVLGLLITIAKFASSAVPNWLGWVAVGCFVAGTSLFLWHATRSRPPAEADDGEGIV